MSAPWGVWVVGLLGLTGTLALVEMCVLFLRMAPRAASAESLDR